MLVASSSVPAASTSAVNPAMGAPVLGLNDVILRFLTPLMVLKAPDARSLVPSGATRDHTGDAGGALFWTAGPR